jgi:hypothetical protein
MQDLAIRDAVVADMAALCAVRSARTQHEAKLAEAGAGTARLPGASAESLPKARAAILRWRQEQGSAGLAPGPCSGSAQDRGCLTGPLQLPLPRLSGRPLDALSAVWQCVGAVAEERVVFPTPGPP